MEVAEREALIEKGEGVPQQYQGQEAGQQNMGLTGSILEDDDAVDSQQLLPLMFRATWVSAVDPRGGGARAALLGRCCGIV